MNGNNRKLVDTLLRAFEARDLEEAVGCFAADALFYDPHYPQPAMQGRQEIGMAFSYIFGVIEKPGLNIRHFWSNGDNGALEVDTHHILKDGTEVRFPQTFVFEIEEGQLTRFQAYAPYPPPDAAAGEVA